MPQIAETRVRSHLIPRGPRGTWTGCSASRLHMKVMAHAQKPDFVFLRNRRVHLNRQGRQFSRLLAAEVCASAVVMLDTPRTEVVWRVLATHSIRQVPLHFASRASPCAITFQLDYIHISRNPLVHWYSRNCAFIYSCSHHSGCSRWLLLPLHSLIVRQLEVYKRQCETRWAWPWRTASVAEPIGNRAPGG